MKLSESFAWKFIVQNRRPMNKTSQFLALIATSLSLMLGVYADAPLDNELTQAMKLKGKMRIARWLKE